ncbi:hypothetical protein DAPPUDRAFT_302623 [Daphnia pulex]|uniref:RING-type domain-containing protein n=1 Tax=Daphnia pulex TaxID=6669 RepID=E9GE14_DAPPU|nr:hypothetical protein DAPPUDRAFT_302623 [Daphnia pulex]|eukprot:EFX82189.1 hypothetical protein DAPPUDRAFT_302623 [Daphnia pulex]
MEEDATEHYITCRVCYLQFDDHQVKPKLLSCSHTVCLTCLKQIYNHGAVIKCPVCRRSDRLQSVEQLPTNQALLHMIKLNEKLKCQKLTCLSESLEVDTLLKELLEIHSPEDKVFFDQLRKIIQFVVKDSTRSLEPVWEIQNHWTNGAYVVKLHQTVISCVKEFTLQHVNYLISGIQARWNSVDVTQRYALLNFIRTLANETDYDDVPFQVLDVILEFVQCPDTPDELMDSCIDIQCKILNDCFNSDLVSHWILNCIQIIQHREQQRSVMVAMKLIRHLCYLYAVKSASSNDHYQQSAEFTELVWLKYKEIYMFLNQEWHLLDLAVAEIVAYMADVRLNWTGTNQAHPAAIQERLTFILMILKYGQLVLSDSDAISIWTCLVGGTVSASDSDVCFDWAYDLLKETIIYLGSRLVACSIEIPENVIGDCLDRFRDECLASRRVPRCLVTMTQTKLMDHLAELLEEEDIPQSFEAFEHRRELTIGIHTVLSLPLKFDINRSIFLLSVTKRGRLLGKIHIKPWALFGSSKFIQELWEFCIGNPRKIGRRIVKSTSDTFVSLKLKNAMFQPVVPELLNYAIWVDSECAEKACQVGITGIQSSHRRDGNSRRVTGWQFVFLFRDKSPGNHQPKTSLRFGDVVQGIDVVKSLCCSRTLSSHFSDGLRVTLEAI